jgi:hypothetical protein
LINEVGSFQNSLNPVGADETLQFRIRMKANTAGIARFSGDPADISPFHDTLVYSDQRNKIPFDQITFVPATIVIGGSSGGGGGSGEGFTNLSNRYDVNSDGFVSPIDVLILVNLMNQGQGGALGGNEGEGESGENYYVDVDSDGFLSPLDALMVVNELNARRGGGSGGNGEGEGLSSAAPLIDAPATKLTAVPAPVLQASLIRSLANAIGPRQAAAQSPSTVSLDSYLASLVEDADDDEEYVDGIAGDLLRVKLS